MSRTPDILVLGHIAHDLIRRDTDSPLAERLGGAAAFAALAAVEFELQTGLVTVCPKEFPLGDELWNHPHISSATMDAANASTFELDYTGPQREVRLRTRAPSLDPARIPPHFRRAPVAYVCPIIGECSSALVRSLTQQFVVVGAQGWMRRVDDEGGIHPHLAEELINPPEGIDVLVFSELDHPDSESLAQRLSERIATIAVTRGNQGSTVHHRGERYDLPAPPAKEVDPTGAGDVFAMVLGLCLQAGYPILRSIELASEAGARVVEGPGLGNLPESVARQRLKRGA